MHAKYAQVYESLRAKYDTAAAAADDDDELAEVSI